MTERSKHCQGSPGIAHALDGRRFRPAVLLHQLAPRVVAAWLDARRERLYSGDSETEKIANTTLEFAAHDLRRTGGLSPVVDSPAPASTEHMSATGFHVTFVEGKPCGDSACDLKHFDVVPLHAPAPMAQGDKEKP